MDGNEPGLDIRHYEDVIFGLASRDSTVRPPFRMGVFDGNGAFNEALVHRRRGLPFSAANFAAPELTLDGTFLYAGFFFDHFGHFITESLSRIALLRAFPDLPIIWHRLSGSSRLSGWQSELLDMLGLLDRTHHFISVPTRVARVICSRPGFMLFSYCDTSYADHLATVPWSGGAGRKLWLSRSSLKQRNDVPGEAAFEEAIAAKGWEIFKPETVSLREQCAAYAAADRIAGIAGSAFHGLLLMRDMKADIRIIQRYKFQRGNFIAIAAAKDLRQKMGEDMMRHISGSGAGGVHAIDDFDAFEAFIES